MFCRKNFTTIIFLTLFCLTLVSAIQTNTPYSFNILSEPTFNNQTAFVNSSNFWVTNTLGPLDDANSTQFNNVGGSLTIDTSYIITLFFNPFDQSLNTTDNVTFNNLTITQDSLFDGTVKIRADSPIALTVTKENNIATFTVDPTNDRIVLANGIGQEQLWSIDIDNSDVNVNDMIFKSGTTVEVFRINPAYIMSKVNYRLEDNKKSQYGDAQDFEIYYNGTDGIISPNSVGTGGIFIPSNLDVTNNISTSDYGKFNNILAGDGAQRGNGTGGTAIHLDLTDGGGAFIPSNYNANLLAFAVSRMNNAVGIALLSSNTLSGSIYFGDTDSYASGIYSYDHNTDNTIIFNRGNEVFRLGLVGDLTIGRNHGSDRTMTFNTNTNDGLIIWRRITDNFEFADDVVFNENITVGTTGVPTNITIFSPDGTSYSCGVQNGGAFACV